MGSTTIQWSTAAGYTAGDGMTFHTADSGSARAARTRPRQPPHLRGCAVVRSGQGPRTLAPSHPRTLAPLSVIVRRMRRTSLLLILTALFVVHSAWVVYTQAPRAPGVLRTEKVKGDLYMISGEGGNVAAYVTSEGVVLVDDMFDRNHADILAQVKSLTAAPLRYVLNTHQHDDHAGGDAGCSRSPRSSPIATRAQTWWPRNSRTYEDTPGTPIGLPRVTFSEEASVHLGGKEVRALYFGRGHTNGDAIVYFPELRDGAHRRSLPRPASGRTPGRGGPANGLPASRSSSTTRRAAAFSTGPARSTAC